MPTVVSDIMTTDVRAVRDTDTLADAYSLMVDLGVRHVPVVNEDKELVGIVSSHDMVRLGHDSPSEVPAFDPPREFLDTPVAAAMSAVPETADPDMPLAEACRLMIEGKFDCLPVCDGSTLVGILTSTDVLKEMARREYEESA